MVIQLIHWIINEYDFQFVLTFIPAVAFDGI